MAKKRQAKVSLWTRFILYINSHNRGQVITRKDLLKAVGKWDNSQDKTQLSIDSYRWYLQVLGYMEHHARGEYKLKKAIPNDLQCSVAMSLAILKSKGIR